MKKLIRLIHGDCPANSKAKTRGVFVGLAVLLVAMVALTGCGDKPGDGSNGKDTLSSIDEETTGQAEISYTDVALTGEGASDLTFEEYENSDDGYTIEVTDGKLTLSLTTPSSTESVSTFFDRNLFGSDDDDFKADPDTVNITTLDAFYNELNNCRVQRHWRDTDEKTYYKSSQIVYVYVDADVTITRAVKQFEDEECVINWSAIHLPLKKGWNLVQVDNNDTLTGGTGTATTKIADKNVPWVVSAIH
jgi:hypothetical protein